MFHLILALLTSLNAADWGTTINGLRLSLSADSPAQNLTLTFENTEERREMFLHLGTAGVNEADQVHLYLTAPDGKRTKLLYTGGNGVAPGRLVPMIVPLLPGSTYSIRTPLNRWYLPNHTKPDLRQSALHAEIQHAQNLDFRFVDCFGLRIFWYGQARSNSLRIP